MEVQATIDGVAYTLDYATNGGRQVCDMRILVSGEDRTDELQYTRTGIALWDECVAHNAVRQAQMVGCACCEGCPA